MVPPEDKSKVRETVATPADKPRRPASGNGDRASVPREYGGPRGPEPTRFGDWERKGRCVDF